MSKSKEQPLIPEPIGNITTRDIGEEMKSSYIDYAMSVIVGRALPDVRDGLKPVHRRILYTMEGMGLRHNKPYKKSARVVGDVLGKYHPHGDSAVYDAMVRMVQDFSMRHPLVDGQGNFGSVDGDPAAAYRYTEARLAKIADELLADIDKETVDFSPNFDGSLEEPVVLPAKIPNLLVNGSTGIAVGMATNMPPHNLGEVCDALCAYIDDSKALDTKELMKIMKGPDFPTAGIVRGKTGIRDYFETGRGSVRIQALAEIEEIRGNRQAIIVTELPYQVNKANLLETIAGLVRDKKINDISDIRDESDRRGMRVVIEIKRDGNANVVLNQLWKHTAMESSFGVIMLALVDGRPRVLPLKAILGHYVEHRKQIVMRRTRFELRKALDRAHILEGFLIALDNIDKVIKIIRGSADQNDAREKLMKNFKLSRVQTQAILDMRLHQLTRLSVDDIKEEFAELQKRIAEYRAILASAQKVLAIIKDEIAEVKNNYANKRRTQITTERAEMTLEDLISKEEVVITLSNGGYVKRIPVDTYKAQGRGGKGVSGQSMKEADFIEHLFVTDSHATLLMFTNRGRVLALKSYEIPEGGRTARGKALVNLLHLAGEEKVSSVIDIRSFDEAKGKESSLVLCTRQGTIKRTALSDFANIRRNGIAAITLEEGDVLVGVEHTYGKDELFVATRKGRAIRFSETDVRVMGRQAKGVRGIRLATDDEVIGLEACPENSKKDLLTVCENGYGKRTKLSEYRDQKRGGGGIITIKASERNGDALGIKLVTDSDDLMIMTTSGMTVRLHCKDIKTASRNTQGVRLVRLKPEDKVARVAPIIDEPEGPEGPAMKLETPEGGE
ncbi:MAG: DNA gyrase subunit A [Elusimicrobia bacterium CG_4_9_14_3_um_filter_62_55]|nr:MAG: DNA gyrase subunit A [Elusimicrobia bacterium CG22_combo_CG10-13_8_21_14_all_63_91]PJA16159.1 MAG: DNA gyrase subunit A [Elusimicrobia bacterium CG_4_10_14_0_2_um_filter_63_34]PJB26333.1 MAG: DNA gyrase subunit A [Elusimicrobia bacterium CG_4_9_14_3_um_filter_62_55]